MNGESPTIIIEKLVKAPPVNKFIKPPKSVELIALATTSFNLVGSAKGTGICDKNLNTIIKPITPNKRFCMSLFLKDLNTVFQFINYILPYITLK